MTWGEFKAWVASRGVKDEETVWYIDLHGMEMTGPADLHIERDAVMGVLVA